MPPCGQLMRVNPLGDGARGFAGSVTGVAHNVGLLTVDYGARARAGGTCLVAVLHTASVIWWWLAAPAVAGKGDEGRVNTMGTYVGNRQTAYAFLVSIFIL